VILKKKFNHMGGGQMKGRNNLNELWIFLPWYTNVGAGSPKVGF
jgi:hypothetical protein